MHAQKLTLPKILFASGAILLVLIITTKALTAEATGDHDNYLSSGLDSLRSTIAGSSVSKRLAISEKLWAQSVKDRRALYKAAVKEAGESMFPAVNGPTYFAFPWTVWDFFPATYNCPHEIERVGRMGDGGKWTCGMSRYEKTSSSRPCVVYSFGVQNESSYEEAILDRTKCEVFGLDYSVSEFGPQIKALPKEQQSRAHFFQAGISSGESDTKASPPFMSIRDLMKKNGHDYIDILKMDIEGFEFGSMETFIKSLSASEESLPIGQLQIELHVTSNVQFPFFFGWWEALEEAGLRPVWTEPNLLQVTLRLDDSNPRYAEYTFINVKHPRNVLLSG